MSVDTSFVFAVVCENLLGAAVSEGHAFTLSTNSDGTTLLTNTETFSGALVWPFQGLFAGSKRANGYDAFNQALKKQVERA